MLETSRKQSNLNDLRSCLEATETFKKAFDVYIKQLQKYNDDKESFKRWKREWNDWKNRTGRYNIYKNHGVNLEFWANEYDDTCWWGENWNSAHKWCHNAADSKGYDGRNYWAKKWGMCKGRYGNFVCGKADEEIKRQNDEYTSAEPKTDPENNKYWLGIDEPNPPQPLSGNNIMCCAQLFDDISITGGGNANFNNIIQNCVQRINSKLEEKNSQTNKPQGNDVKKSENNTNDNTNVKAQWNVNNNLTVTAILLSLVVVVSILICMLMLAFR